MNLCVFLIFAQGILLTSSTIYTWKISEIESIRRRSPDLVREIDLVEKIEHSEVQLKSVPLKQTIRGRPNRDSDWEWVMFGINQDPLIYRERVPWTITKTTNMTLTGTTYSDSYRFTFNFHSANSEYTVPLHVSVRFDEQAIVVNSCEGGWWAVESRKVNPLAPKERVKVKVNAGEGTFRIFINEKYMMDFKHPLPLASITHFSFGGDLRVESVEFIDVGDHHFVQQFPH